MLDLQVISSVLVLTVNLTCSIMLWVLGRGSKPKTVLALLSSLLVVWNIFALLLMPELRFDRLGFYYLISAASGAALIYIYLLSLMRPARVTLKEVARLYIAPLALCVFYHIAILFHPHVTLESYRDIGHNLDKPEVWLRIAAGACLLT